MTDPLGIYFHPMTYGRRGVWDANHPAPTIRGVQRAMPPTYEFQHNDATTDRSRIHQLTIEELAILQSYPPFAPPWADRFNDQSGTAYDPHWPAKRPALTVATKAIVPNPGHNSSRFDSATKSRNDGLHITVAEAATLQTYPTHITKGSPMGIVALDLFAGHGWGVACQWLGIEEHGVELMDGAVATREANGMSTIYRDVWDGLEGVDESSPRFGEFYDLYKWMSPEERDVVRGEYELLIASPPCQTFSMAGGGSGRKALDEVVGLIDARAYMDVAKLREFGERHDPRTALVLTPLAHVYRDLPRYVVLEQVPPVLPVWERMAEELQKWGYSTWTGVLNAEQYGVPQTRRRAILIAKRDPEIDGPAAPPEVTHSRYYSRDPEKLDEGVLPWVSMADALGWGMTQRPGLTVTIGAEAGGTDPMALGGSGSRATMQKAYDARDWAGHAPSFVSNDRQANSAKRASHEPAPTITAGHDSGNRVWMDESTAAPVTLGDVAGLQTYPQEFVWPGNKTTSFLQIGNAVPPVLAWAVLKAVLGER